MKASQFSDAQKAFVLKQGDEGVPVAEICRKARISQATYFNWKKKYAGMLPPEMKTLKQLEGKDVRLKKIVADLTRVNRPSPASSTPPATRSTWQREMTQRKLILIDTDVDYLGDAASSFFGRFFIALILKAARQRFQGDHRPVYLYIDECGAYLDDRLELMLQQARKANIGIILAHQDSDQPRSAGILTTILGNTATKFAGRLSDADTRLMAANMRTSPEFIRDLPRYHFAMSTIGETTVALTADTARIEQGRERANYDYLVWEMEDRYGPKTVPDPVENSPRSEPEVAEAVVEEAIDEEIRPSSTM